MDGAVMDDGSNDDARERDTDRGGRPQGTSGAGTGSRDEEPTALLTRLRVIEDQPLPSRAEALAQVHDELRAQLESGDAARTHA